MKLTKTHKMAIASTLGLMVVAIGFVSIRARKRDARYGALVKAITRLLADVEGGLDTIEAFDLQYKNKVLQQISQTVITLKKQTASAYAKTISEAWKAWYEGGDDEDKVYGVFRNLKDKVQVSQVVGEYQDTFGMNLIDVFKDRLSKSEIKIIMGIVAKLPPYRTL